MRVILQLVRPADPSPARRPAGRVPVRDRTTPLAVVGVVLVLLTVVSVLLAWLSAGDADSARRARGVLGVVEGGAQVRSLAFAPDGRRLYAATGTVVRAYRLGPAAPRRDGAAFAGHTAPVVAMAVTPDGRRLVTAAEDDTVRIWDTTTRAQVGDPLRAEEVSRPAALAITPDGALLAVGGEGGTVLWDLATRRPVDTLFSASGATSAVAFGPDGARVATGDAAGGTIRLWEVATGQPVGEPLAGHGAGGPIRALAFDRAGDRLFDGSSDGRSFSWDLATRERQELRAHDKAVGHVAATPDGVLVTAAQDEVILWDVAGAAKLRTLLGRDGSDDVNDIALAPDGDTLAVVRDHRVLLWSVRAALNR